jgi:hypothetical protein
MKKIILGIIIGGCISATPIGNSLLVTGICGILMGVR